eukprot:765489-Hanusia_phi.AAC.2
MCTRQADLSDAVYLCALKSFAFRLILLVRVSRYGCMNNYLRQTDIRSDRSTDKLGSGITTRAVHRFEVSGIAEKLTRSEIITEIYENDDFFSFFLNSFSCQQAYNENDEFLDRHDVKCNEVSSLVSPILTDTHCSLKPCHACRSRVMAARGTNEDIPTLATIIVVVKVWLAATPSTIVITSADLRITDGILEGIFELSDSSRASYNPAVSLSLSTLCPVPTSFTSDFLSSNPDKRAIQMPLHPAAARTFQLVVQNVELLID